MRTLVAKEYFVGQVPLAGEYALYKDNDEHYFVVGDGRNTIENMISSSFSIPENVFDSVKRLGEKYPLDGGPYKCEELDGHDLHDIDVINDFMYETIEGDA